MDWILFGLVVVWLGIISWFDIRKDEIPHSAWVVVPFCLAILYQFISGLWPLVFLAVWIALTSERERISGIIRLPEFKQLPPWMPLFVPALYWALQVSPVSALALLGFWAAWELRCWGGADAVAAMTLVLFYPGWPFILAFLAAHVLVLIGMGIFSLFRERKIRLHSVPGLPILFAALILTHLVQGYIFSGKLIGSIL